MAGLNLGFFFGMGFAITGAIIGISYIFTPRQKYYNKPLSTGEQLSRIDFS